MTKEIGAGYTTLSWILAEPLRDANSGAMLRDESTYDQTFSLRATRIMDFAPGIAAAAALVSVGLLAVRVVIVLAHH